MERIRIATIYYCTCVNYGVASVRDLEIEGDTYGKRSSRIKKRSH